MSIIWGKVISDIYFWNRRRKQELSVLFIVEKELAIIRENQGMELHQDLCYQQKSKVGQKQEVAATIRLLPVFILIQEIPVDFLYHKMLRRMRTMCKGRLLVAAAHRRRKAEQVPQGLRDTGCSKRTCPLCSIYRRCENQNLTRRCTIRGKS